MAVANDLLGFRQRLENSEAFSLCPESAERISVPGSADVVAWLLHQSKAKPSGERIAATGSINNMVDCDCRHQFFMDFSPFLKINKAAPRIGGNVYGLYPATETMGSKGTKLCTIRF